MHGANSFRLSSPCGASYCLCAPRVGAPRDRSATAMMIQHRNARRSGAAALALLGATLCSAATHAAEPATAFVIVGYSNQTAGPRIVAGDYRGAALALNQHSQLSPLDPGAVATNRCVSFAMTAQMFA